MALIKKSKMASDDAKSGIALAAVPPPIQPVKPNGRRKALAPRHQTVSERVAAATQQVASGISEAAAATKELSRAMEQIAGGAEEAAGAAQEQSAAIKRIVHNLNDIPQSQASRVTSTTTSRSVAPRPE